MIDQLRPSIIETVSTYVSLRRSGEEYSGLCPFHSEKTASFYVNEDKGTFYCHGCHEGGDVITFIQKIEGLDFKGAIAHLGLTDETRPTPAEIKRQQLLRETSRNLAAWALTIDQRVGVKLRQLKQWLSVPKEVDEDRPESIQNFINSSAKGLTSELITGWIILTTLEQDLSNPDLILSLWQERQAIERLVGDAMAYSNEEIEIMHPPLTDSYKQQLFSYARGEAWGRNN